MTRSSEGRKKASYSRGILEQAGLAETAWFLGKAKQALDNARFSLDNTDFSSMPEMIDPILSKVSRINSLIAETRYAIELSERAMADMAEDKETAQPPQEEQWPLSESAPQ